MPVAALATHTAIVGAAGSGKTWLAKGIVEEAILHGIPVLAVDPQGDLVQFLQPRDAEALPQWERQRFDRYWKQVEPRVITPGSSHAVRLSLNPLRLPRVEQLAEIADATRRDEEFEGMLNTIAANLASLGQVRSEATAQTAFLVKLLRAEQQRRAGGTFHVRCRGGDPRRKAWVSTIPTPISAKPTARSSPAASTP